MRDIGLLAIALIGAGAQNASSNDRAETRSFASWSVNVYDNPRECVAFAIAPKPEVLSNTQRIAGRTEGEFQIRVNPGESWRIHYYPGYVIDPYREEVTSSVVGATSRYMRQPPDLSGALLAERPHVPRLAAGEQHPVNGLILLEALASQPGNTYFVMSGNAMGGPDEDRFPIEGITAALRYADQACSDRRPVSSEAVVTPPASEKASVTAGAGYHWHLDLDNQPVECLLTARPIESEAIRHGGKVVRPGSAKPELTVGIFKDASPLVYYTPGYEIRADRTHEVKIGRKTWLIEPVGEVLAPAVPIMDQFTAQIIEALSSAAMLGMTFTIEGRTLQSTIVRDTFGTEGFGSALVLARSRCG